MAGYIMTLGSSEYLDLFYTSSKAKKDREGKETSRIKAEAKSKQYALEQCILKGIYAARCKDGGGPFIGTLADYLGMKSGDDIYFFTDRKIYGIGKLIDIAGIDCRFRIHSREEGLEDLVKTEVPEIHQLVCTFIPAPHFFRMGVDIDEALMFSPDKIRALRFFSKRSFMKLDDVESDAIKNIIARKNERYLKEFDERVHYPFSDEVHKKMEERLKINAEAYILSVFDYIKYNGKNVSSEYFIEGAIMDLLRHDKSEFIGSWDFVGRQYPASPPKPSEYEESMDLFGYRYVPSFQGAISKYMVIELKAGIINKNHVQQTMKYVDWISREYTKGDYSMIEAYTIGFDKEENIESETADLIKRNYIIESRPVKNREWQDLKILSYCKLLQELRDREKGDSNEQ